MLKVGRAKDVQARTRGHIKTGAVHGNPVTSTWVSLPHGRSADNERLLIRFCEERGELASGGERGEYFLGVKFEEVRAFAESLDYAGEEHPREALVTAEVTFSELIQKPRDTVSKIDRTGGGILLRRRDAEDLYLGLAKEASDTFRAFEIMVTVLAAMARRGPEGVAVLAAATLEAFPWARHLPDDARQAFTTELIDVAGASASLGTTSPLAPVIAAWKSTAEVYADPELSAALRTPPRS
jgi:hypothetical protein